ncbi:hypothetical protein BMJ29_36935 [Sinorhizobium medicae]|uniref:Uncharacterized protein n=1 Tax=Sinorhizobium medicae TaxID=110321 RepID=A0ABX4TB42_9HYPH|nr:hypothetical protein BMJ33_35230 [Sinorhizobium medicae]PLU10449.1 hypothetical protein BMJ29_36935 [Sinorhizobium medicae]PLU77865.1 hypothetical protein BMJ19_21770 [Sinorhizobium medicae]
MRASHFLHLVNSPTSAIARLMASAAMPKRTQVVAPATSEEIAAVVVHGDSKLERLGRFHDHVFWRLYQQVAFPLEGRRSGQACAVVLTFRL